MSIIQGTAKSGGSASFYDYPIGESLRFDGTSSYLSRTPATAGNRQTWTWSGWVKRGNLGVSQVVFGTQLGGSDIGYIAFNAGNELEVNNKLSDSTGIVSDSTRVFRDVGAWYHLVIAYDGNQSNLLDRLSIYVNGESVTHVPFQSLSAGNGYINTAVIHGIGYRAQLNDLYLDGYLANIQFIDGQALDPYFFGETKDNIWVPYNAFSTAGSGTATASDGGTATDSYGTNGFHLDFANDTTGLNISTYSTSTHDIFSDSSAIATYSLNGNATDLGGSYDATESNITYGTGKFGQAAIFNGSNSVISRTDQVLPTSGDYSISLWFNPASGFLSTLWGLFSCFQSGTSAGIAIYGNGISDLICNFGSSQSVTTKSIPSGRWIHLVATLSGTTGSLYIDGAHMVSTTASNTINTNCDFKLGYSSRTNSGNYAYNQYFNGSIDEVRVFNKALSINEIETLYTTGGESYFMDKSGSHNHWIAV